MTPEPLYRSSDIVRDDGRHFDPDDYADFGAAFNAAVETGATVYLPPLNAETYSTPLTIHGQSGVTVKGAGMFTTGLQYTGSERAVRIDSCNNVRIEDVSFLSDGTDGAAGVEITTTDSGTRNWSLNRVGIAGFDSHAIHEWRENYAMWDGLYRYVEISDCGSHAYRTTDPVPERTMDKLIQQTAGAFEGPFDWTRNHGQMISGHFVLDRGDASPDWCVSYTDCRAEYQVQGDGFHLEDKYGWTMQNNNAEGCGDDGYYLRNVDRGVFFGNKTTECSGNGITGVGTISGMWFLGGTARAADDGGYDARFSRATVDNSVWGMSVDDRTGSHIKNFVVDMEQPRFGSYHAVSADESPWSAPRSARYVRVDSSTGPVTLQFPEGWAGRDVHVWDHGDSAGENPIEIEGPSGYTIAKITSDGTSAKIIHDVAGWRSIYSNV